MGSGKFQQWVTLYTDASHKTQTRYGGWGCWLRFNDDATPIRTTGTGRVPEEFAAGSTICELFAIVRGIELAYETWDGLEGFFIRSDSTGALGLVRKAQQERWHHRQDIRQLQKRLHAATIGVSLNCKHVKGHQNQGTVAGWLNAWCDREAGHASRHGQLEDGLSLRKKREIHLHMSDRGRPLAFWGAPKEAPVVTVEMVKKGRLCLLLPNGDVQVVHQRFETPNEVSTWAEDQAYTMDQRAFELLVGRYALR